MRLLYTASDARLSVLDGAVIDFHGRGRVALLWRAFGGRSFVRSFDQSSVGNLQPAWMAGIFAVVATLIGSRVRNRLGNSIVCRSLRLTLA